MPPKKGTKRKAEAIDTVNTRPKKKTQISLVDRWNGPVNKVPQSHAYLKVVMFTDIHKRRWQVPEVTHRFPKIEWDAESSSMQRQLEDGLLVSPMTVATSEQMNAVERKQYEEWEEERYRADPDWLDPNTMSPFYPGTLELYRRRRLSR